MVSLVGKSFNKRMPLSKCVCRLCGVIVLLVFGMCSSIVCIASAPVTQRRIDLSGRWDFRFDTKAIGESEQWFGANATGQWNSINVPGSFNDQFYAMNAYAGNAWYRTTFSVATHAGERVLVHFEGNVLRSKVWVNGQFAGQSLLPFTPFEIDVTKLLASDNTLVVETDNKILARAIPDLMWTGWENDGGIIWPVSLVVQPPMYSQAHIDTIMDGRRWNAHLQLSVYSTVADSKAIVDTQIIDGSTPVWSNTRHLVLQHGETALDISAPLSDVHAWCPDDPHLYVLLVRVHSDLLKHIEEERTSFGFRQVRIVGTTLLLNGKPLILKGINRHSFYPGVGMSVPAARTWKDFEDIKALGANFVRLAHYSQPEEAYQACDRLGLLVWTEIPVWQTRAEVLTDPNVWDQYIAPLLRSSVTLHWNHPSVIVWSVANEIPSQEPDVARVVARSVAYVKRMDSSRLVTFASDKRERDISFGPVDFIAINEYFGWYYGTESDLGPMLDLLHNKYPHKPIFVSEFGAESIRNWRQDRSDTKDYSYAHQAAFLQNHLDQIYAASRRGFMLGGAPWLYNDFPLPFPRGINHVDGTWTINAKGVVTQSREKKPAWMTVKQFYRNGKH